MRIRLFRAAPLALAMAATLAAQSAESFAGEYKGDELRLVLQPARGAYTGTIFFQGAQMPVEARNGGDSLTGRFSANGEWFPFDLRRDGAAVVLTTQGVSYRLMPAGAGKPNPLARGSSATDGGRAGASRPGSAGQEARSGQDNAQRSDAAWNPEAPVGDSAPRGDDRGRQAAPAGNSGLVGAWQSPTGTMQFNADGTGVANGEAFRYQADGATVTMSTPQGSLRLGYRVQGNSMTLSGPGGQIELNRMGAGGPAAGPGAAGGAARVAPELAGKWCYVANVYATGGGARASNQCFTLHPDGRYEYFGETDSYGAAGGATSQSGDRGTWSATETSITARSASGRVTTYTLQKRNHPKNNDPMLLLNGQAFVTFYQKPPWR